MGNSVKCFLVLCCTSFLLLSGNVTAGSLQKTDSGAPSALLMFPVSSHEKGKSLGMKPVMFNHLVHETRIEECATCHHTGDAVSCTTCHTVEGKAEGKFITLERAMHATFVSPKKEGKTPESCVSCHTKLLSQRECAGCHSIIKPTRNEAWCAVCHTGSPALTDDTLKQGIARKLTLKQREELAEPVVLARKPVKYSPLIGPYKVSIDTLADHYAPSKFTHRRHVTSLIESSKDDELAQAFHSTPQTVCTACHHNSLASDTPSKCSSCHRKNINPKDPERPILKAAFHLQCMSCHKAMNVERPKNTNCRTCHKKPVKTGTNK